MAFADKDAYEKMRIRDNDHGISPPRRSDRSLALRQRDLKAPMLRQEYSLMVLEAVKLLNSTDSVHEKNSFIVVIEAYHYLFRCYVLSDDPNDLELMREKARNAGWKALAWTLGRGHQIRFFQHLGKYSKERIYEYADALIHYLVDEASTLLKAENRADPPLMVDFEGEIILALETMLWLDDRLPFQQEEKRLKKMREVECKQMYLNGDFWFEPEETMKKIEDAKIEDAKRVETFK